MSVPDTPDYQRGVVAAQQLLGSFIGTAATETVTVPANVEALLILVGPVPDPIIEITGVASGVIYPSYTFWTEDDAGIFNLATVVVVASQVDTEVQVKWGTAPGRPWWVLADTAGRFTFDAPTVASTAKGGQNAPLDALQVAGSDGTDLRVLLTDASGRLQVTGAAFPPVYAAPGTAAPADALQVGGTDGADLRALLVDSSGHALTIDQTLKLAIAALGAALPADAVLVAGSDGTDLRALATDTSGHALTIDQALKLAIAAVAATPPADVVQVGGSDGTHLRAFFTDIAGRLLTVDLNLSNSITALGLGKPADALQVAGNDGTNLRALLTDTSGHALTIDQTLKLAIAALGAALPADAVLVAGSDGIDLRAVRTNQQGAPYAIPSAPGEATGDRPPNELLWANAGGGIGTATVIAAPGAGKAIRLFFVHAFAATTAALFDAVATEVGGASVPLCVNLGQPGATPAPAVLPLTGLLMKANTAFTLSITAGAASCSVGYTIETV